MNTQKTSFDLFPLRYQPTVWLPAAVITFGFLILEDMIHAHHPIAIGLMQIPTTALSALLQLTWEGIYLCGYILYLTPLAVPAIRVGDGIVRRVLAGSALQLLVGFLLVSAFPAKKIDFIPCLQVANALFTFWVVNRFERLFIKLGVFIAFCLIVLATFMTQRHDWMEIGLGLLLGWICFNIAFSKDLEFLDQPHPWSGITFHLNNIENIFIGNRPENWETSLR